MGNNSGRRFGRWLLGSVLLLALVIAVAACGGGGGSSSSGTTGGGEAETEGGGATTASTESGKAKCGLANGEKATGSPIKIGAIVTKQPGIDFTEETDMAKAYFDCVNANGGINGRPVEYIAETEQSEPGQVAGLAKKLIESDKVVAMVGDFSLIDCTVNYKYYESKGFYVMDAGVAGECYTTSNSAPINMGPRYSSDGAVQALIKEGVKKIVFDTPKVPGAEYIGEGPTAVAKAEGVEIEVINDPAPIQDPSSTAQKLVQAAGSEGGVVINNTPPEALKIFQAAAQQGLLEQVKWGCSTSCNNEQFAEALGSEWNGKLFVNAELNLVDSTGADNELYRQVQEQYAPEVPLGSYGQMGFLLAKIATDRLLTIKGEVTPQSANKALLETTEYKTDLLCKPWYYLKGELHIPNNTDWTVVPEDGQMVEEEGCAEISDADPDIAKARKIEKELGVS